jgi:hypothetical protein
VLGLGRGSGAALGPAYEELWCVAEKYRVPVVLRDVWPVGSEVRLPSWSERWKRSGCADRD